MVDKNRDRIKATIRQFTEKFNRDDLDGVMEFFAEDSLYVEYNGNINEGKQAIRKAFEPQFNGIYGKIRFHDKDIFIDELEQKAVFNWWCTIDINGKSLKWEGLDLFRFESDLIKEKRTFAQASILQLYPSNLLLFPRFMAYMIKQKIKHKFK